MAISSMTGFARQQGHDEAAAWTWEARSVNGRGLDVRCRLATGFEDLEQPARDRIAKRFKRGNLQLGLSVSRTPGEGTLRINKDALDRVLAAVPEIRARAPECGPPTVDGLLALKGVVELVEEVEDEALRQRRIEAMLSDLDRTLDSLAAMRADEGRRLAAVLGGHLDTIGKLTAEAGRVAATQPKALLEKLKRQVDTLIDSTPGLSEERLAQECALLAAKADVREELDRLTAHVQAAGKLLSAADAQGRRLDFLSQEFNREANTLCSKSQEVELTRIGLELKATIDQFREQVQNIE